MPGFGILFLIVAIGVLVLIPTRRLYLAGLSTNVLTAYYLTVVALGLFVAELRGPARYLIPVLVVAYVAPFVTARHGIARLRNHMPGGPARPTVSGARTEPQPQRSEPKNVTPKETWPPDAR